MSAAATYLQPAMSQPTPASSSRRPAHRPTTYSGSGNYTSSAPQAGSTTSYHHQSPIPPPPRTSSNKHSAHASAALQAVSVTANSSSKSGKNPVSERVSSKGATRRDGEKRAASTNGPAGSSSKSEGTVPVRAESSREPSRRRQEQHEGHSNGSATAPPPQTRQERIDAARGEREGGSSGRKETRFGNYLLGRTLGEGEFGKVKLGWRKDGGVQVAIKLIRRDTLAPHPNRLSKIYREISILRTLSHPNIVKLFEMIENERHIGIILEYASGGELFDYILTHRYLKDPPACRLFAQLVSGVGYLHKMGIVHRDLKLENLLLDRNRNIIITDFGFANVFDPLDDISEYEDRLDDPNVLKELERGVGEDGRGRRGDLMATSCGSPCYAAPELVVSDGVYTGRKVDVWSCGVILYAMLAGYLPFDDDPANPEGDNINLLYKYIVSTPLTFPEYVTPHARDLLRRILVPDPRKRADLFEVARHSWLSPFANVVGLITSSTTTTQDIMTTTVTSEAQEQPVLTRSASVREPSTTTHVHASPQSNRNPDHSPTYKASGDTKRNTVQVEYVQPKTQTKRERQSESRDHEKASSSKKERTHSHSHSHSHAHHDSTASSSRSKGKEREREPDQTSQPSTSTATASKLPVAEDHRAVHKSSTSGVPRTQAVGSDTGKLPNKHHPRATSYQGTSTSASAAPTVTKITVGVPVVETHTVATATQTEPATETRDPATAGSSSSSAALPAPQAVGTGHNRPTTSETAGSGVSRSQSVRQTSYTGSKNGGSSGIPQPVATQSKIPQPTQKKPYTISNPIPQDPDSITMNLSSYAPAANPRDSNPEAPSSSKGHKRANTVGGPSAGVKIFDRVFGEKAAQSGQQTQPAAAATAVVQPRPSLDHASGQNSAPQSPTPRQSIDQGGSKNEPALKATKRRFSLIPWGHKSSDQGTSQARRSGHGKLVKHDRRLSRSAGNATDPKGLTAPSPTTATNNSNDPPQSAHATSNNSFANINGNNEPTSQSLQSLPQDTSSNRHSTSPTNVAGLTSARSRKFGDAYSHDGHIAGAAGSTGPARRVMDFFRKRAIGRSK
ncbi:Serine/threonine-protein kinase [Drechslerella dactyloides]|uniref:non-specific serine/threonine protein kinase n=1 Tax=Drechslerella dactyloides TaxID=74499 RepID=A0AAD6J082_DREDA|nr:Serine/threonine-protein kinase [Drechslerella dactyloides]